MVYWFYFTSWFSWAEDKERQLNVECLLTMTNLSETAFPKLLEFFQTHYTLKITTFVKGVWWYCGYWFNGCGQPMWSDWEPSTPHLSLVLRMGLCWHHTASSLRGLLGLLPAGRGRHLACCGRLDRCPQRTGPGCSLLPRSWEKQQQNMTTEIQNIHTMCTWIRFFFNLHHKIM